ncbi:MAG TPA: polymer-forming cytoskeletal protein [Thermoanaerobaculia bacterium]|nr:polymer-forming cytoskeletal protein [Thermoanaerobaculia bacterium]
MSRVRVPLPAPELSPFRGPCPGSPMPLFRREDPARRPDRTSPAPGASSPSPEERLAPVGRRREAVSEPPAGATRIGPGLVLEGNLTGSSRVEIAGTVEGEVRVDGEVLVLSGGLVRGRVAARVVRVEGRVEGDIEASERAEVADSGSAEGDVVAPRVAIAEGAFFKGNVKMGGRPGSP